MTNKFDAGIFKRVAFAIIFLPVALFLIGLLFLPSWRYDALPAEKRIAKDIERAAFGTEYRNSDPDYCRPNPSLPVCSADFDSNPPGRECYFPRCRWGHVTDLYLDGGQLDELPAQLAGLPGLVELSLRENHLTGLPTRVGELRSIRKLDLSANQLGSLPREIGQLGNLTELDLSRNQLTRLPPEIGQLQKLTSLNLSGNQLTSLPVEIGRLRNLTQLDLGGNPLSGPLPEFLTHLPLARLEFSNTDLCVPVDDEFQKWIQGVASKYPESSPLYSLYDLCSLAEADQSAMLALYQTPGRPADWNLQALPCTWPGVGCDSAGHIITLDLLSAKFSRLPPEIGRLGHLQFLRLSYAQLTELPPEIGELHSLTYLELVHNQLSSLPSEIGQLRNLQTLELVSNQLTELPAELGLLTNLKWLDVSHNPLRGPLPNFLTNLPNVRFIFEDTNLCVPNNDATLNWLRRQSTGYYNAEGRDLVYVPPDPEAEIDWLLENRGCE